MGGHVEKALSSSTLRAASMRSLRLPTLTARSSTTKVGMSEVHRPGADLHDEAAHLDHTAPRRRQSPASRAPHLRALADPPGQAGRPWATSHAPRLEHAEPVRRVLHDGRSLGEERPRLDGVRPGRRPQVDQGLAATGAHPGILPHEVRVAHGAPRTASSDEAWAMIWPLPVLTCCTGPTRSSASSPTVAAMSAGSNSRSTSPSLAVRVQTSPCASHRDHPGRHRQAHPVAGVEEVADHVGGAQGGVPGKGHLVVGREDPHPHVGLRVVARRAVSRTSSPRG